MNLSRVVDLHAAAKIWTTDSQLRELNCWYKFEPVVDSSNLLIQPEPAHKRTGSTVGIWLTYPRYSENLVLEQVHYKTSAFVSSLSLKMSY